MEHEQWGGVTNGTTWMHKVLIGCFKVLNLNFVYAGMAVFVVPFYMIFAHKGYISMYHFFRQRMNYSSIKSFFYVYANHVRFGQVVLDRFAAYAGEHFHFDTDGHELFMNLTRDPSGFMIASSHVGNYELAGYAFKAFSKKYYALVFGGEAKTIMENRERFLNKNNISMIVVKDDLSHIIQINNALSDGDIVSIPGDRIFGSPKYVDCPFMGGVAKFPYGLFTIAVRKNVRMLAIFSMKQSTHRYKMYFRELSILKEEGENLSREEKTRRLACAFAQELEKVVKAYPAQWFNYFEFWNQ